MKISFILITTFLKLLSINSELNIIESEVSKFMQENFELISSNSFGTNYLRKINISENDSKILINNLLKIINRYIYLDIIKNPPQPKENYFNIVDLEEELNNINTEERPLYDFVFSRI